MKILKGLLIFSLILVVSFSSCGKKQVKDDGGKKGGSKSSQNRTQETGYATIFDNDTALARDRATDDAKNKLVAKVLGESVYGQSLMKDFELVSTIVEAKSYGLVKDVVVIKQGQQGNEYVITIEGTVEVAAVEGAIKDALERYGKPKFMVLIQEKFENRRNQPGFTETEMVIQEVMGNSGFEFVDAKMTQELMNRQKAGMNNAIAGNISADVQQLLLNTAGAEVIIIGQCETNDQTTALQSVTGATNMKSKQAIVRIKAIDVYTGKILAVMSRNAPGAHIDANTASKKAIENVMKQILGRPDETGKFKTGPFMSTIIEQFVRAAKERQINISITGLDYNELRKFSDQISNRVRGVKKVIPRGQADRKSVV